MTGVFSVDRGRRVAVGGTGVGEGVIGVGLEVDVAAWRVIAAAASAVRITSSPETAGVALPGAPSVQPASARHPTVAAIQARILPPGVILPAPAVPLRQPGRPRVYRTPSGLRPRA